uniref:Uncharacterized protein n=1 Tax=Cyprinus carpio TaxID=7962 RepID=A0A8C1UY29_CYPCA
MFAIQPVCLINSDEELRAVSIGTRVCHPQQTYEHTRDQTSFRFDFNKNTYSHLQTCVHIWISPSATVVGKTSTMAHKLRNGSMEAAALEPKAILMRAQTTAISTGNCFLHSTGKQTNKTAVMS